MEDGPPFAGWGEYLLAVHRPARWADGFMLVAAAEALARNIVILEEVEGRWRQHSAIGPVTEEKRGVARGHATLILALKQGHFCALELVAGRLPPSLVYPSEFMGLDGAVALPRGGGKSARIGGASSAAGVSVGVSRAARVCGLPVLSSAAT
eukprot:8588705-Alexandrium_andersonii.AAC.1